MNNMEPNNGFITNIDSTQGFTPENAQAVNNMNQMLNVCNGMTNNNNTFANFGFVMGAGLEGGVDSAPMQMGAMLAGISSMMNQGAGNQMNMNQMNMNQMNMNQGSVNDTNNM